ncbi:hypothetical protein quinque_006696 [Culex quinquefasciatus]
MASILATLATLMDNVTKTYALWVKVIQGSKLSQKKNLSPWIGILGGNTKPVGASNRNDHQQHQVAGILLNAMDMSGMSRRRLYPYQVRTNMDRADCHKLYLTRYNARRLG